MVGDYGVLLICLSSLTSFILGRGPTLGKQVDILYQTVKAKGQNEMKDEKPLVAHLKYSEPVLPYVVTKKKVIIFPFEPGSFVKDS